MSPRRRRFIPGIFNYCDYWCERCSFTWRCWNFALRRSLAHNSESDALSQSACTGEFWQELADRIRLELPGAAAEACDEVNEEPSAASSDCDATGTEDGVDLEEAERLRAVRGHPLSKLAGTYRLQTDTALESARPDLEALAAHWLSDAARCMDGVEVEEAAREIGEHLDVIHWYRTLIPAKTERAVWGMLNAELGLPDDEEDDGFTDLLRSAEMHDAEGSAKVVLIAIERSIAAWLGLREYVPEQESAILDPLMTLERLRRNLLLALPGAESFRRPGFDGEPEDETVETE